MTGMTSAQARMLGPAQVYLTLIDRVLPVAQRHSYRVLNDEVYEHWRNSDGFSIQQNNLILASELLDKAHLAAITSLIRNRRWAEAVCDAYKAGNYLAWTGATRGLLESSGDILDGLLPISISIAENHHAIRACLAGKATKAPYILFKELESLLDHFVLASRMRRSKDVDSVRRAKDNVDYVKRLNPFIPDVETLYHRLCAIVHPAAASIDWTYDRAEDGTFKVKANDLSAIDSIVQRWPDTIPTALEVSCNSALLILRVLHKFDVHPQLSMLKDYNWKQIGGWTKVEAALRR